MTTGDDDLLGKSSAAIDLLIAGCATLSSDAGTPSKLLIAKRGGARGACEFAVDWLRSTDPMKQYDKLQRAELACTIR